jgi:hypothetical protein
VRVGNSQAEAKYLAWEATVKVYGVAVAIPAGVEPGASLVDRMTVNVGTTLVRSRRARLPGGSVGIGATSTDGPGGAEPP